VLVEFAVAVDDAEGVPHFVEDGGEEVVFTGGWAVGGGLEVGVCSGEFGIILWGSVDEPADSVGIVVDGDGGGFGGAVGVVADDGAFGQLSGGEVGDVEVYTNGCGSVKLSIPDTDSSIINIINCLRN
jgi:hypothetical protein